MNAKTVLHFVLMALILILAQMTIFNRICLFGVAVPLVFIYLLIKLPVTIGTKTMLTIGFLLGLCVDIFSDTQGMNALACTVLSALRLPILRLYFPREDEMTYPVPSMRTLGPGVFLKYAFSMVLVYCILFFIIESFTFFNFGRLVLKIVASSALTFILILSIDSITSKTREKRL